MQTTAHKLLLITAIVTTTLIAQAQDIPHFNTRTIATNLDTPWALAYHPPNTLFATLRPGAIVRIHLNTNKPPTTVFTSTQTVEYGEGGMLGLALDPHFNTNHYAYIAYGYQRNNRYLNKLVRLTYNPKQQQFTKDKELLTNMPGAVYHDGGRVKIGPDNKIYWTIGDAGTPKQAQNTKSYAGKILRINTDGTIPTDNPFPNSYIYSYGHRNPQGLAWDNNHTLYATEHGPSGFSDCCKDEINKITKGNNYGWPTITGYQTKTNMTPPLIMSGNNHTWAPSGMAYASQGLLKGLLLFTALRGKALYTYNPTTNTLKRHLHNTYGRLRDIIQIATDTFLIATQNRDGRGFPKAVDDRIIELTITAKPAGK